MSSQVSSTPTNKCNPSIFSTSILLLVVSFFFSSFSTSAQAVPGNAYGLKISNEILGVSIGNNTQYGQQFFEGYSNQENKNYAIFLGVRTQAYANQPRASGLGLSMKLFSASHAEYEISAGGLALGVDYTYFFRSRIPVFIQLGYAGAPKVLATNGSKMNDTFITAGYEVLPNSRLIAEFRSIKLDTDERDETLNIVNSILLGVSITL